MSATGGHHEAYRGLVRTLHQESGPEKHLVFVFEDGEDMVRLYELRDRGDHVELLRMFIQPELIGLGLGRVLGDHAVVEAGGTHQRLLINSDPGATGFHRAMGAEAEGEFEPAASFVITVFWHDLAGDATGDTS